MLHASLLEPSPSEQLAARALEREAALATQLDLNALTLGFRSRELERAYAPFRDALSARALRSGLFWLACAYIPLEVSLELWQYTHHGAIAHFAWAFALVAAAALTAAFAASHGRGAHADTIGCLLLVTLAAAIVGRASYARVDPLAPPVAVSLFFFVAAGPPILRLRFVAMAATFLGIVCAHFAAIRLRRSKSENAPWYEVSLGLAGVLSALSCRWLEHGQRREFYLMALLAAAEAEGGSSGLPPGGALLLDDGSLGASRARHTPVDEALRELRELAHRLTQHLPHQHLASLLEARVPTDAMERALEEAGVSSLAELLFSGHGSHGLPHAHAHVHAEAAGVGVALSHAEGGGRAVGYVPPSPGSATRAAAAAASGAPAELTAAALTIENGALSGWAVVAAAREAGGPVRLVTSDALPPYFSAYAYVHTAYRVELSGWQALASVLQWHNETLNVWTELLPAAAFAAAIAEFLRDAAVGDLPAVDRCLLSIGLVVALIIRPICSAAAHLLYCMTDSRYYALWWSVDYISICAAILAVSLVCARNAFFCEPELAHLFFVCSSGLLCTSMIAVLCIASSSVRAFSFLLFVLFCNVVPLCYQLFSKLEGWYHNDCPWSYIYYWALSLVLFLVGVVVKSTSVPEYFFPGKFDFVGSSHQLWHLTINLAFVFGTLVPWRIYVDWRAQVPCPAPRELFLQPPSPPPFSASGWPY